MTLASLACVALTLAPTWTQDVPVPATPVATARNAAADEFEARLAALLARDPQHLTRRELARTSGGLPVSLVAWNAPASAARPAVLVCDDGIESRASLDVLEALIARAATDGASADTWTSATVYYVPLRDPDHALAGAARASDDYPEGWLPWTTNAPYPLARPEARALAQFVVDHREIATLVRLVAAPEPPNPALPGTLALFAASHAGLRTIAVDVAHSHEAAVEAIARAARELPRLSVATAHVERLRPELWLVDVPLSNSGQLATAPNGDERWAALRVRMEAGGARVVSVAIGRGSESFRALPSDGPQLLGHMAGGEVVTVRWVVEAPENALLSVAFDAPRAGTVTVSVPLL